MSLACPKCGNTKIAPNQTICTNCGTQLTNTPPPYTSISNQQVAWPQIVQPTSIPSPTPMSQSLSNVTNNTLPINQGVTQIQVRKSGQSLQYSPTWSGPLRSPPQLQGSVDSVQETSELPDQDMVGWAIKGIIGIILLPIFLFLEVTTFFIALFIGSQRSNNPVPVRNLRVIDATGQMRSAKMKGDLVGGDVHIGDDVELWGVWKNNSLDVRQAYNKTLNSLVELRPVKDRERNKAILITILVLFVLLVFTCVVSSLRW